MRSSCARRPSIELQGRAAGCSRDMLVATGSVLSVFSKKPVTIKAASASIGIRGTGAYIEVMPGERVLLPLLRRGGGRRARDGRQGVVQHDAPRGAAAAARGRRARCACEPGPFRNHTDAELVMLESLVRPRAALHEGRDVPGEANTDRDRAPARRARAGRNSSQRGRSGTARPRASGAMRAWSRSMRPARLGLRRARGSIARDRQARCARRRARPGSPRSRRSAFSMNSNGSSSSATSRSSLHGARPRAPRAW